jgi:hypothetical protein
MWKACYAIHDHLDDVEVIAKILDESESGLPVSFSRSLNGQLCLDSARALEWMKRQGIEWVEAEKRR